MTTLDSYYKDNGISITEGYSKQVEEQVKFLREISSYESINNILEIGFNGGHSSEIFLSSNKNVKVVSFDINAHHYVMKGKNFIDKNYPVRHTLITGDSTNTIPKYQTDIKFDIIFIDGGHDFEIASKDVKNCKRFAKDNTILIVDDIVRDKNLICHWNQGPNKSWKIAIENGDVVELGQEDYERGRGQAWGLYKNDTIINFSDLHDFLKNKLA